VPDLCIDLMVALCSCREEPLPKPRAAASWESFGFWARDQGDSKEALLRQVSPEPEPIPHLQEDQIRFLLYRHGDEEDFLPASEDDGPPWISPAPGTRYKKQAWSGNENKKSHANQSIANGAILRAERSIDD
jgi:hypothetical protein